MSTWADYLNTYSDYLTVAGQTPETVRVTIGHLTRFSRSHPDPWAVTAGQTKAWLESRGKANTVHRAATALRGFYSWALDEGLTGDDPTPLAWSRWILPPDTVSHEWWQAIDGWTKHAKAGGRSPGTIRHHRHYIIIGCMN